MFGITAAPKPAPPSTAFKALLGGSGELVTSLIMGIIGVTTWVIGVIKLLTKSP